MIDCVITQCHVLSFLAAESISLTPSFGAVHTGGFVVIAGPNLNTLNMDTAARIRFGVDGEELSCVVQKRGIATVICPVPLFPPDDTGVKAVTFTINSIFFNRMIVCTHKGQYRVGKQQRVRSVVGEKYLSLTYDVSVYNGEEEVVWLWETTPMCLIAW